MTAPNSQTTSVYLGGGTPQVVGDDAGDQVVFFGTTPVSQQTKITAISTSALVAVSGAYGFATEAQATALVAAVNTLIAQVKALGLQSTT